MQILKVFTVAIVCVFLVRSVDATPLIPVGDTEIRHDIEYLADRGLISVPITTWPISWADLILSLESIDEGSIRREATRDIVNRLRARTSLESRWGRPLLNYSVGAIDNRSSQRTFDERPRGSVELIGTLEYTSQHFYAHLQAEAVSDSDDDQTIRFDESHVGLIFGNVAVEVGGQSSWWGPGHAGNLILSNNARAIPVLSVRRNSAVRFQNRWLRWMGPWSARVFAGQLESDRFVSRAMLLGARATIKPKPYLELGVSRTAQWAGSDRPDSFSNLIQLILGRDNRGEIDREEEPGNQLAGFDARMSLNQWGLPVTLYGQLIGEDEAGGFPSRYLGMGGVSTSFALPRFDATARLNFEFSDTTCQFNENSRLYNCAYNHSIYRTGYRYRGRSIGHSTDNDSRQLALIATINTNDRHSWVVTLRDGTLNRGGPADPANSLTATPIEFSDIDLKYTRPFREAKIELGVGFVHEKPEATGKSRSDARFFARWSRSFD